MKNAFNNESDALASLLFLFMHSDYGHIVNPDLGGASPIIGELLVLRISRSHNEMYCNWKGKGI